MGDEVSNGRPVSTPIGPSAKTLSGFRTLDMQTDRLLSSWLREAGIPDGALKADEPAPDFLLPEANGRLVSSLELRRTAPLIVTFVYGTWSIVRGWTTRSSRGHLWCPCCGRQSNCHNARDWRLATQFQTRSSIGSGNPLRPGSWGEPFVRPGVRGAGGDKEPSLAARP
jgi:hypothetical protein